jgi:hypothetical protein
MAIAQVGTLAPLGSVGFAMADTTKLSVGKALDKLRGTDEPKSKMTRLDEKIDDLDKETQRLRAMRRSLGPGKKGEPTKRD